MARNDLLLKLKIRLRCSNQRRLHCCDVEFCGLLLFHFYVYIGSIDALLRLLIDARCGAGCGVACALSALRCGAAAPLTELMSPKRYIYTQKSRLFLIIHNYTFKFEVCCEPDFGGDTDKRPKFWKATLSVWFLGVFGESLFLKCHIYNYFFLSK